MSICVTFKCDGCDAEAPGTASLRRHFESINNREYGFGSYKFDTANEVAPEGWTPYCIIGCTYCPACSAEIDGEDGK